MILLSHERQCFSRTNKRSARRRPPRIRFAVLCRIEILHILLEHFYDSQRNENASSGPDFFRGSESREARICSVRSDSSGGLPSSNRLHTSSQRIRAAS